MSDETLYSVGAIRAANASAGGYWFSPDTMRFFRTRVGDWAIVVEDGTLFGTSERNPEGVRLWSVRFCHRIGERRGDIETIGEFHSHTSSATAKTYAKRRAAAWRGIDAETAADREAWRAEHLRSEA